MTNPLYKRNIISISELNRSELELVLRTAKRLKEEPDHSLLANRVVASLFFEASTRTRLSFETAIQRLGGSVIGFADANNTSMAKKGETLADSIRIISNFADAIVMRHPRDGAARLATEFSKVPVINAGDGSNQHPSQTLLDLFTIYETQKVLDNLKIAFVGDLKYGRTVHSLAQALSLFNAEMFFVAPDALAMPDYMLEELYNKNIRYSMHKNLESLIPQLDILYMTRVQKERFEESEYHSIASQYVLYPEMFDKAKPNLKILHPLPRVDEIDLEMDKTPYAYYFQQAENGVYAREALLSLVLNEEV